MHLLYLRHNNIGIDLIFQYYWFRIKFLKLIKTSSIAYKSQTCVNKALLRNLISDGTITLILISQGTDELSVIILITKCKFSNVETFLFNELEQQLNRPRYSNKSFSGNWWTFEAHHNLK